MQTNTISKNMALYDTMDLATMIADFKDKNPGMPVSDIASTFVPYGLPEKAGNQYIAPFSKAGRWPDDIKAQAKRLGIGKTKLRELANKDLAEVRKELKMSNVLQHYTKSQFNDLSDRVESSEEMIQRIAASQEELRHTVTHRIDDLDARMILMKSELLQHIDSRMDAITNMLQSMSAQNSVVPSPPVHQVQKPGRVLKSIRWLAILIIAVINVLLIVSNAGNLGDSWLWIGFLTALEIALIMLPFLPAARRLNVARWGLVTAIWLLSGAILWFGSRKANEEELAKAKIENANAEDKYNRELKEVAEASKSLPLLRIQEQDLVNKIGLLNPSQTRSITALDNQLKDLRNEIQKIHAAPPIRPIPVSVDGIESRQWLQFGTRMVASLVAIMLCALLGNTQTLMSHKD